MTTDAAPEVDRLAQRADAAGTTPAARTTEPWHRHGGGPDPTADGPVVQRWRKVAGRTLSKAWDDSLFGISSQAAFWSAMSTAPLLLALLGLVGPVAEFFGPETIITVQEQLERFLRTIFSPEVADNLLGETVETILDSTKSGVISVGLVISFWAGSSAISAFVEAITIAYGQHEVRHPVRERFFALGLYMIALFAGILLLPLIAIGPDLLPKLFPGGIRDEVASVVSFAYYPALGVILIVLLATLYKVAPKRRHAWRRGLPGALLAAGLFLIASLGLRLYLTYAYSNGLTYGALTTPITFLIFYYLASLAIVLGAQFNNALLEYYPPRIVTTTKASGWKLAPRVRGALSFSRPARSPTGQNSPVADGAPVADGTVSPTSSAQEKPPGVREV
ncbi:MAG: YihY/virulence factor BrkB family protein [Actinomycetota bacterium]|nr:YihY/virulence factor BrkB family protein [Actinomycetota bacterium]